MAIDYRSVMSERVVDRWRIDPENTRRDMPQPVTDLDTDARIYRSGRSDNKDGVAQEGRSERWRQEIRHPARSKRRDWIPRRDNCMHKNMRGEIRTLRILTCDYLDGQVIHGANVSLSSSEIKTRAHRYSFQSIYSGSVICESSRILCTWRERSVRRNQTGSKSRPSIVPAGR